MSYEVLVNGQLKTPLAVSIREALSEPAEAQIRFPIDLGLKMDDVVEIKRNGVLIFKGLVEAIGLEKGEGGLEAAYTARDYLCKLERLSAGDTLFPDAEPADIIRALVIPTVELSSWFDRFSENTLSNYSYNRGTWEIAYGLLRGTDSQIAKFANLITGSGSWGDCQIRSTITPLRRADGNVSEYTIVSPGIIARWQDTTYFMAAYLNEKKAYLSRMSATETIVAEKDFGWEYGKSYVFRLRLAGTKASLWINEEKIFDEVDMGAIPSAGKAGVSAGGVDALFDDFMVGLAGWTASASTNPAAAGKAIDGDLATAWAKELYQAQGDWFQVDLGSAQTISRVTVFHEKNAFARNWKLEVSTDGSSWTTIASKSGETRQTIDVFFPATSARYVRMALTGSAQADWAIAEFAIAKPDGSSIMEVGQIDATGQQLGIRLQHENLLEAARRVAEIIGWELWAGTDGKLYFKQSKGTDRSAAVKFEAGRDLLSVEEERDALDWATRVFVTGHGEWREALRIVAEDQEQIAQGNIREKTFLEPDLIGRESLQARARTLLAEYKDPLRRLQAEVLDPGGWELGDMVRIVDPDLGIDEALRVVEVEREWSEAGEEVRVALKRPSPRIEDILAELKGTMARLTFYSPDTSIRYNAERLSGAYWFRFWTQKRRLGA